MTPEDYNVRSHVTDSVCVSDCDFQGEPSEYDTGHLVMTSTALLCLSILRDDFSKLDRQGILRLLRSCQQEDGRYAFCGV